MPRSGASRHRGHERDSVLRAAGVGVLAAVTGMGVAHLVAALLDPSSSPVYAVGAAVIDLTPTPVKEWAVSTFGTADKAVLLGSVLAGTLILAAVAGIVAGRRRRAGAGILVLLTVVAAVAALSQPTSVLLDVVPSVVAAVVGVGVLLVLLRPHRDTPSTGGRDAGDDGPRQVSRRGVLLAGALAGAGVASGVLGEWIATTRTRITSIVLPAAAKPEPPLPPGLEQRFPGISKFQTPNPVFYRVDTRLTVPNVNVGDWTLTIDGDVARRLTFSFDELLAMPLVEHDITLTCVSNPVGGDLVGAARWLGVPLVDLLDRAGVGARANQILSTAVDGFTISTPLEAAADRGRTSLVAVGMNGEPLPAEHGFPARLVVPGIYGFIGATKWLQRMTLTTYAAAQAYWTERGWATTAPIKLSSRIDIPKPLARLPRGQVIIGGVAWAQPDGVAKVEVRIDGGAWQPATLGPAAGPSYWRQWYLPWQASEPGRHTLAVRATDRTGQVQTSVQTDPFPDGSSGIQQIVVFVE